MKKEIVQNEQHELELLAEEIMSKLKIACQKKQIPLEELLIIGINIFADSVKESRK